MIKKLVTLLVLAILLSAGCAKKEKIYRFSFKVFDEVAQVEIPPSQFAQLTRTVTIARERIETAAAYFDPSNPKSELSLLNELGPGVRFPVDKETQRLLRFCQKYTELTEGAFDVSTYPISYMWGFLGGIAPNNLSAEIAKTSVASTGMDKIRMRENFIQVSTPFAKLDLSAILDGYLTDLAILKLRDNAVANVRIQVGNSVRSLGVNERGQYWKNDIPHPKNSSQSIGQVILKNKMASSCSSIYRKTIKGSEGEDITHIIDPVKGVPAKHTLQVITLAPTATASDALATALVVHGVENASRILTNFERCHALIIPNREPLEVYLSEGAEEYFVLKGEFAETKTLPLSNEAEQTPAQTLDILDDKPDILNR